MKFEEVKKLEQIDRAVGFIFSRCGFTEEAEVYCREKGQERFGTGQNLENLGTQVSGLSVFSLDFYRATY